MAVPAPQSPSYRLILRVIADPLGDAKFWLHHQAVRQSFSARQDLHVVCLLHEVENFAKKDGEQREMVAVSGEQGRLTFAELSEHGASKVREVVERWRTNGEKWEVKVADFAPVSEARIPVTQTMPRPSHLYDTVRVQVPPEYIRHHRYPSS